MPKLKTKKAVRKRFKVSSRGKVLRSKSHRRHLLGDKNPSRKRALRRPQRLSTADEARLKRCLPYG